MRAYLCQFFWTRLGLTEEEIARITAIFDRTEQAIHQARLEIDVLKAELKKVLFQDPVDVKEVERLLKSLGPENKLEGLGEGGFLD